MLNPEVFTAKKLAKLVKYNDDAPVTAKETIHRLIPHTTRLTKEGDTTVTNHLPTTDEGAMNAMILGRLMDGTDTPVGHIARELVMRPDGVAPVKELAMSFPTSPKKDPIHARRLPPTGGVLFSRLFNKQPEANADSNPQDNNIDTVRSMAKIPGFSLIEASDKPEMLRLEDIQGITNLALAVIATIPDEDLAAD